MIYCCSDIHGRFDRYKLAVDKIKEDDTLYILGDVIDRYPGGLDIIKDIKKRKNVELILGNHEYMMLNALLLLTVESITNEQFLNSQEFLLWTHFKNGGAITYNKLLENDLNSVSDIIYYLMGRNIFERISVNGQNYYLGHASANNKYMNFKSLKVNQLDGEEGAKDLFNMVWFSPFDSKHYSPVENYLDNDEIYILGHRPVQRFGVNEMVCINNKIFDIDGGCGNSGDNSSLILLCLDTMKEEYLK